MKKKSWLLGLLLSGLLPASLAQAQQLPADTLTFPDTTGSFATFSGSNSTGRIDQTQSFFQPIGLQFGGNNRTCASCHRPEAGWSLTPTVAQNLFNATNGLDPLFLPVDGANAPNADRSTVDARRRTSSLLLNKGLIRIPFLVTSSAEFRLVAVSVPQDGSFPSDFAANALNTQTISVFRRPPSTGNMKFLTDVMWDGRFTLPNQTLAQNLLSQALGATRGHLQGNVPAASQLTASQLQMFQSIVNFETNLFGAQIQDNVAGRLDALNALGGPFPLFSPPAAFFQGGIFNLYTPWANVAEAAKRSVQRGEAIFNTRVFNTGGNLVGQATCTTCHNNRGTGDNLNRRRFNLALSNPGLLLRGLPVNAPLPVYTLRRNSTGETVRTTDPGRILISGRWGVGDGDAFRPPLLRGLAARAPYFHGGQAPTLVEVVRFYNGRFAMGLTTAQQQDLVNFLLSL
jgi:mono/diheme cytochrome c family protein